MPENVPVSKFNPKANPLLYAALVRVLIAIALRYHVVLDESSAGELIQHLSTVGFALYVGIEWAVHFFLRHRVKPVHSDGTTVKVKPKP